ETPISWGTAPSRFQMEFWPSCPMQPPVAAAPDVGYRHALPFRTSLSRRTQQPAARRGCRGGRADGGDCRRGLPALSVHGAEREDGADRTIAEIRGLDRCRAGADRP